MRCPRVAGLSQYNGSMLHEDHDMAFIFGNEMRPRELLCKWPQKSRWLGSTFYAGHHHPWRERSEAGAAPGSLPGTRRAHISSTDTTAINTHVGVPGMHTVYRCVLTGSLVKRGPWHRAVPHNANHENTLGLKVRAEVHFPNGWKIH